VVAHFVSQRSIKVTFRSRLEAGGIVLLFNPSNEIDESIQGVQILRPPQELNGRLTNLGAAALDQNDQHDHKQNSGYDPDQSCVIHVLPLSSVI
jgi:hypothetical protein